MSGCSSAPSQQHPDETESSAAKPESHPPNNSETGTAAKRANVRPKPKPAKKPAPARPAKVANAASGKTSKKHSAAVKDGETAYDFSRFF